MQVAGCEAQAGQGAASQGTCSAAHLSGAATPAVTPHLPTHLPPLTPAPRTAPADHPARPGQADRLPQHHLRPARPRRRRRLRHRPRHHHLHRIGALCPRRCVRLLLAASMQRRGCGSLRPSQRQRAALRARPCPATCRRLLTHCLAQPTGMRSSFADAALPPPPRRHRGGRQDGLHL